MACRGIRGAISVEANGAESIVTATRQLLENIVSANGVAVDDLVSIIFTVTPDLDAADPARAARELGWVHTPLLCMPDLAVEHGLPRCVRVLLHWNTDLSPTQIRHVYLGAARTLRPDLMEE